MQVNLLFCKKLVECSALLVSHRGDCWSIGCDSGHIAVSAGRHSGRDCCPDIGILIDGVSGYLGSCLDGGAGCGVSLVARVGWCVAAACEEYEGDDAGERKNFCHKKEKRYEYCNFFGEFASYCGDAREKCMIF